MQRVPTAAEQYTTRFDFDQPIFILSVFTTIVAFADLLVSAIHLTLPLNLAVSALNIVFFAAYFVLRYQHKGTTSSSVHKPLPWTYSWICILGAALITALYPLSILLWAVTVMTGEPLLIAQIILSGSQILFMGGVTIMLGFGRRHFLARQVSAIAGGRRRLGSEESSTPTLVGKGKHVKDDSISIV